MRRLLCWLGFHSMPAGLRHELSLYFSCSCCGALVPGGLATNRRRK